MSTTFSPKLKRNISRIIPFGVIWLVIGWVFLLTEHIASGNQNLNPESAITLTLPVFIFASLAVVMAGLAFGTIELIVLEKKFRYYSFGKKVAYKFFIYLFFIVILIGLLFPIATAIELGVSIRDESVWTKTLNFYTSLTMVNTVMQLSFHILISLLYAAISENIGHNVLSNILTGKYHAPTEEDRIFMFLDMKDSTTIAEKLGHKEYFNLLQQYYEAMSTSIIETSGEVYQYIGDEIVITWSSERGLANNNCLECFLQIKKSLKKQAEYFIDKYHIAPDFKAGLHIGNVTTGEIGALKKEIVYTGDVLNTTARIQALCKENHTDLIISDKLLSKLNPSHKLNFKVIGDIELKGKAEFVKIHKLQTADEDWNLT